MWIDVEQRRDEEERSMRVIDLMRQSIGFLQESFRTASDGLNDEQLHFCPEGETHSIAWVLWHAARIEDLFVQRVFQNEPEVWSSGGWAARTGLPERGFGTNQPTADAKTLRIADRTAFAAYQREVAERTRTFLDKVEADESILDREVKLGERTERIGESITLHMITHLNGHRGEINLLRGMMGFPPVLPNRGG
jgi:uncharacterized damage-inducible protein DinB